MRGGVTVEEKYIEMLTEEESIKLLEFWVETLGLQDWNIKLKYNVYGSTIPDCNGRTNYVESNKTAAISILSEEEYNRTQDVDFPFDWEKTLVHELLHLKLSLLDDSGNTVQDRIVHQLVDSLARALVKARRA